ncbi:GNAT family N-acetyltransferase [Macrococcus armenti]|uniref:GNAT family N-acetyltransferase n=1 Tax=Macrococcus armenti TaxID=2875764 RepID=UPI001CCA7C59|nr:GNAT family N-acetyltransferase [Macrococcus armenti]UBH15974.1 GNAT family N-acetyltransferase [Macrococcus armenti]UBH18335.1 GNAT family N-acetyltransferase [Macrococcus armenti]UBH20601.1 GNAT family N-acetyltransferase [Macrococcus armenti]
MSIHILLDSQNVMGMMTCLPIKELKCVTLKKVLVIIKLRKLSALKIILKNPKSLFALMRVREGKENEYHISMIATLPEFQGRGVAKQLIAYAEAISVAEGFKNYHILSLSRMMLHLIYTESLGSMSSVRLMIMHYKCIVCENY